MNGATGRKAFSGPEKMPTGIEGLDQMTGGGLPRNRTTLIMGGPGSGKTVLALQTLVSGARRLKEPAIFVAFEEASGRILANAATFGWDLPALAHGKKLFFFDARLAPDQARAGEFDLAGMLAAVGAKAKEMRARRIVFDGLDVLLSLLEDPAAERREIFRLHDWLSESGLTGIMTAKTEGVHAAAARYGFLQFMVDCAILLTHGLRDHVSLRNLRVLKYRGSGFTENEAPLVIGRNGIAVASLDGAKPGQEASTERVSSGIRRLDGMLGGGYYRGASVLITGAPGTAKSTLSGAFAAAACRRRERALYISFDESPAEITRNFSSVGIRLAPHVRKGLLRMSSSQPEASNAREVLIRLKELVEEHRPRCLVIDPLSALTKAGGRTTAVGVVEHLLQLTKSRGITVVCTSLSESPDPQAETTALQVSTVADTWIHLSYAIQAGERNRALTIIKSRGMEHSNQVRELILASRGITLADVYTAGGQVLMGTLRWERERAEQGEQDRLQADLARKQREIELARAELNARMEALQRELAMKQADLDLLLEVEAARRREVTRLREGISIQRGGRAETGAPLRRNGRVRSKP